MYKQREGGVYKARIQIKQLQYMYKVMEEVNGRAPVHSTCASVMEVYGQEICLTWAARRLG